MNFRRPPILYVQLRTGKAWERIINHIIRPKSAPSIGIEDGLLQGGAEKLKVVAVPACAASSVGLDWIGN